ncbi:MAG: translocation/assembly module TamB domain-containing protein [Vicinamibacterales bacterium]
MADQSQEPVVAVVAADPEETADSSPRAQPRSGARRAGLYVLAFITAVLAALVVTLFTVDVGPQLRARAEQRGSSWLARPMHIGSVKALLRPGAFEFRDVVIEGLTPTDRPFLVAKRMTVSIPWWTAFSRRLVIESVEMTDWHMVVESFPQGRHNFPRVKGPPRPPRTAPKTFFTTLRQVVASRGHLTYVDHSTPWTIDTPNIHITYVRRDVRQDYGGTIAFDNGTVRVQTYEPFGATMKSRFSVSGGKLHFDQIDLLSDGAQSVLEGDVDLNNWPEQTYRIKSRIDIATQKSVFFHKDKFDAAGGAEFEGTFHYFKGGRELKGAWRTQQAQVRIGANNWGFSNVGGKVLWVPSTLEITDARASLYGGAAQFDYRILSLDQKSGPKRAVWDVQYQNLQLPELTDFLQTEGIRLDGTIRGHHKLEWPLGKWATLNGSGELFADPPAGVATMGRELPPDRLAHQLELPVEAGPFNPRAPLGYVPIAAHLAYQLGPDWITLEKSWAATEKTYVEFGGRTAYYQRSNIPFHVTSLDWQEADRVFAGVLTAFGSPTSAVPVGGSGQFDGTMLNAFAKPRIEGTFSGDHMRAFDVDWGRGTATLVVEDGYAVVSESSLVKGNAEINAVGKFSLGYPRRDGGEQVNARIRMSRWLMPDLRHAFVLDDWPVEGRVSGEYRIYGNYETPYGFGRVAVTDGVAYGEAFDRFAGPLGFEGNGVRLPSFEVQKSTGLVTGAAWVGWDGTYSFNADGSRIPVESLKLLAFPKAPLSGIMRFTASGTGTFDTPRYDVKVQIADLFVADEGIGHLNGQIGLRGELATATFDAASSRLAVSGAGRVALTEQMDADMTLRFSDTSLDPYVRFFEPRLSPFTNAVVGGTVRVSGELMDIDQLVVDARVEQLDLKLFDYQLRNKGPIELSLDRHVAEIGQLRLQGEGTELEVTGSVSLHDSTINVTASGDANLGILQGFYRDIRSSGVASLRADVSGSLSSPVFSGSAGVHNGRIRYLALPHALESVNGTLSFDAAGIRVNDVRARMAGGDVVFGGRIGINGFVPGELSLTATGENMHLRYPEGFPSSIDADLTLRGTLEAPSLSGKVTVRDAVWSRRFETNPDLFNFGGQSALALAPPAAASYIPLRLDIQIDAPSTLRIENNLARLRAKANLDLRGTYERPLLFGRAEIDRGDVLFEGNRYVVTRGTIDFSNPVRIEPYVDIEAETRVRVPGESQTYRVTIGFSGTTSRFTYTLNSDPPLPEVDIVSLLFGRPTDVQNAEVRLLDPTKGMQTETDLLKALSARLLASPISAPVGRVVEQTLGVDTVQITPVIGTETNPFAPSARLVIGKRLSNRAYLTFARPLGTTADRRDQILVIEYDQNDRLGWVVTSNGDRTFAIDFRVRHVF